MPGVKGAGGPPPKRQSQRRRVNKPEMPIETAKDGELVVPRAKRTWHPIAKLMYASLAKSGQSVFYTSSDWAAAYVMCESMSREFKPQPIAVGDEVVMVELPPKAAAQTAWSKTLSGLMATEGDRRRLRLELVRQGQAEEPPHDDGVSELDEYRRRLQSG